MNSEIQRVSGVVPARLSFNDAENSKARSSVGFNVEIGGDITFRVSHYGMASLILDLIQKGAFDAVDIKVISRSVPEKPERSINPAGMG